MAASIKCIFILSLPYVHIIVYSISLLYCLLIILPHNIHFDYIVYWKSENVRIIALQVNKLSIKILGVYLFIADTVSI